MQDDGKIMLPLKSNSRQPIKIHTVIGEGKSLLNAGNIERELAAIATMQHYPADLQRWLVCVTVQSIDKQTVRNVSNKQQI